MTHNLAPKYVDEWFKTSTSFPTRLRHSSKLQRARRERKLRSALNGMPACLQERRDLTPSEKTTIWEWARGLIVLLLPAASSGESDKFMNVGREATESFLAFAKNFTPGLSDTDVFQALRNFWVFNSLQHLLGAPVALTPSAFAYSMLYPCTDNRLDKRPGSDRTRGEFLDWLSFRLKGMKTPPKDADERIIDRLLQMIELEYPRDVFPRVHGHLMAIHNAQRKSLRLQGDTHGGDERDLVLITVEKGGTSVLADGFLVAGSLSVETSEALFAFGVLLQLMDDLQDVDEDLRTGHSSVFTRAAQEGPMDLPVIRLLNFALKVTQSIQSISPSSAVGTIVARSCMILILESIAHSRSRFTLDFLRKVDSYSPVRLSLLETIRARFAPLVYGKQEEALTSAA